MSDHKLFSYIKSGIRLAGYLVGAYAFQHNTPAVVAFAILFAAEIIGVMEEEFEK